MNKANISREAADILAEKEKLRHQLRITLLSSKPFPIEAGKLLRLLAFYSNEVVNVFDFFSAVEEGLLITRGMQFQILYAYPLTRGKLLRKIGDPEALLNLELRMPYEHLNLFGTVYITEWTWD